MSLRNAKKLLRSIRILRPEFEGLECRMLLSANPAHDSEQAIVAQSSIHSDGNLILHDGAVSAFAVILKTTEDGTPYQVAPPSQDRLVQLQSLADRVIHSDGFADFKSATAVPAVSPALEKATSEDLVVTYDELLGPTSLTAVVLKPRPLGGTYDIPIPVEGENVYEFIHDHFELAMKESAGEIKFPPNHVFHVVPPQPDAAHLKLEDLRDVTIDLNGSTLQLSYVSPGVKLKGAQRVIFKNGSIKGVGQLATVASVVADDSEAGYRFVVLPAYRTTLETTSEETPQLITVGLAEESPSSGYRIKTEGYAEIFTNRGAGHNNFTYQDGSFVATSPLQSGRDHDAFSPGDFVWLLHQNNGGMGMILDSEVATEDVTLEDLDFINIPGMGIAGEVVRGLHINNVRLLRDADDPMAFWGVSSDGIHINGNGGDIVIENSYLGPNGDDKITVKGNYWKVTDLDHNTNSLTVRPVERNTSIRRWGWAGQKLAFINRDFSVVATSELAEDSVKGSSKRHELVLTEIPQGVAVGTLIGNVDNSGPRLVIRNNVFEDTRAQAILVRASHVVVEGNTFSGIAGPVVDMRQVLDLWFEAVNTRNILVQNNEFARSSQSTHKSNELIRLWQYHDADGQSETDVEVIDHVKILGNWLVDTVESLQPNA